MGTYLSTPVLDKHTERGSDLFDSNTPVRWAVVDMQGWRKSMEDAHIARTDVLLPKSYSATRGGDGGDGNDATHAKVFAVFDGHGGAEVARFCQIRLVPVLTSQSHWTGNNHKNGENATIAGENKNMAACIGHALIDSFHAMDRLVDDPSTRPEIEQWRSERPPPYVPGSDEVMKAEFDETQKVENEPMDVDDAQQRRHTVMDPSEIAEDASKLHMMDAGDDESDDADESTVEAATDKMEEGSNNDKGGKAEKKGGAINGTSNLSNMLDADNDDEDEVFEDSLSEPSDVVHDDSEDEEGEQMNANENDDGEVVDAEAETPPAKEQGTMVLTANDAVALFQKLLHMNGKDGGDKGTDEGEEETAENGDAENDSGGGGEEADEVVIPTRAQLLNPPTGIVAQSASVPTRIQNGRKICNLPDHPVHAGCTSVVAVIVGRTLVVANAGDSRAVICRAGGLTEPLSFDHKPLQNREMNRITNSGGFVNQFGRVNGNLNLSRSIGDLKYKQVPGIPPSEQMITAEPDILSTTLREGDEFMILGCDGIWDCLSNEECVKYVYDRINNKHPHEICVEMLDEIVSADPRASQGIGGDNMTIMIVDLLPQSRPYHSDGC